MVENEKKYFAFISYSSKDVDWAIWLLHELEHYPLPASFNGRTDIRRELRPVFRDKDELSAGDLTEQIENALENSQNLIVICSPYAKKSEWVDKEIEFFKSLGRLNRIFPFIIEGNEPEDYFPPSLCNLPKNKVILGGDVKDGREQAFIKVVAGMLNLKYDSLWKRHDRYKIEKEERERKEKENLYRLQSRLVSEKVIDLVEEGDTCTARKLALQILPSNLEEPQRPYTVEAERALRMACSKNDWLLRSGLKDIKISPDGKYVVIISEDKVVRVLEVLSGKELCKEKDVEDAEFSSDGKYVVITPEDEVTKIWKVPSGELYRLEGVKTAEFSPDGEYVVTISKDEMTKIWKVSSREELYKLECAKMVYFTPDGKHVVTKFYDESYFEDDPPKIRIWGISSGQELYKTEDIWIVVMVDFSSDGKYVVTVSGDCTARIWETSSGKELYKLEGAETAEFSPDSKYVVTVSRDCTARIWETSSGKELYKSEEVKTAEFSPDSKYVVFILKNYTARICEASSGKEVCKLENIDTFKLYFSSDCKYVLPAAFEDSKVRVWEISSGKVIRLLEGHEKIAMNTAYFISDKYVVTISNKIVRIWDILSDEKPRTFSDVVAVPLYDKYLITTAFADHETRFLEVSNDKALYKLEGVKTSEFSYDGKYVVTISEDKTVRVLETSSGKELCKWEGVKTSDVGSDGKYELITSENKTIRILETSSGKELYKSEELKTSEFGSDGKYKSTIALDDKEVHISDVSSGEVLHKLVGHTGKVNMVKFSPYGKYVVTASEDNTARIWVVSSGEVLHTLVGHMDSVSEAYFSSDGKYVLTVSLSDRTARIWKVSDGKELYKEKIVPVFKTVMFSPDGKYVVVKKLSYSLDKFTIRILEISSGKEVCKLENINTLDFSLDGKYVIASEDRVVRIWEVSSGIEVHRLEHNKRVHVAKFSPDDDGRYVMTISEDNTARIWEFKPLQELIDEASTMYKDCQFTQEERRMYYLE